MIFVYVFISMIVLYRWVYWANKRKIEAYYERYKEEINDYYIALDINPYLQGVVAKTLDTAMLTNEVANLKKSLNDANSKRVLIEKKTNGSLLSSNLGQRFGQD